MSIKRAVLFGHTDSHGVTMTAISLRNLLREGYRVITHCKYVTIQKANSWEDLPPDCGTSQPRFFWGQTIVNWDFSQLEKNDIVVTVDIPLPVNEGTQAIFKDATDRGLLKIKQLIERGIKVFIIDHHEVSKELYSKAREIGANVIFSQSAVTTHYGIHDEYAEKWGRIGAISDRDILVLPVTEEEEMLSEGLDGAVRIQRNKIQEIIELFVEGNEEKIKNYLLQFTGKIPNPQRLEIFDKVVYAGVVDPSFGFKQLEIACKKTEKPYAVGINLSRGAAIVIVTYWKSKVPPAAERLKLTNYIGHPTAPVIPLVSTGRTATQEEAAFAEAKAREIVRRLET